MALSDGVPMIEDTPGGQYTATVQPAAEQPMEGGQIPSTTDPVGPVKAPNFEGALPGPNGGQNGQAGPTVTIGNTVIDQGTLNFYLSLAMLVLLIVDVWQGVSD